MLTRSVMPTPFGFRLTYALDGENYWTEYVTGPRTTRQRLSLLSLLSRLTRWAYDSVARIAG